MGAPKLRADELDAFGSDDVLRSRVQAARLGFVTSPKLSALGPLPTAEALPAVRFFLVGVLAGFPKVALALLRQFGFWLSRRWREARLQAQESSRSGRFASR